MSNANHPTRKPAFLSVVSTEAAPVKFTAAGVKSVEKPAAPIPPATPVPTPAQTEAAANRALERVDMALQLLRAQGERLAEQARSDALELAFLVARRILDHEVSIDPSALMSLIRSAIAKAGDASRVQLRLNPKDIETVKTAQAQDHSQHALSFAKIELIPDGSLEHGDCVVDTDLGTVDGRLATRLSEMREAIGAALGTGT